MTQQIVDTELEFTQQFGNQEQQVLTEEAIEFLTDLVARFAPQRKQLLAARQVQQQKIDRGELPDFISETNSIKNSDWKIRGIPRDLQDRRETAL